MAPSVFTWSSTGVGAEAPAELWSGRASVCGETRFAVGWLVVDRDDARAAFGDAAATARATVGRAARRNYRRTHYSNPSRTAADRGLL